MQIDPEHPENYQLRDGREVVAIYPSLRAGWLVVTRFSGAAYDAHSVHKNGFFLEHNPGQDLDLIPKPKMVWYGFEGEGFELQFGPGWSNKLNIASHWPYRPRS